MEMTFKALSDAQVENIHQATLDLLETYGIQIASDSAKAVFEAHGCTIDGHMVKIPARLVEASLKTVPKTFTLQGRSDGKNLDIGKGHDPVIIPAAGGVFVIDETGEKRTADMADLQDFIKLCHTSDVCNVTCSSVIYPKTDDVPRMLLQQVTEALALSDKPLFAHGPDRTSAARIIEMAAMGTGRTQGAYIMNNVNSLSPMAWDENMLDVIMLYAEKSQPLIIGCCSMSGFTSHIFLENTLVTNNAEVLTGIVLSQLVNPGAPVIYANTSGVADMKKVSLAIGSPELLMLSTAVSQLAKFYDVPFRTGGGLTDAKSLDMQAGIESAQCLMVTLANGTDVVMHSLGTLESFNSLSPLKWMVDEEICRRFQHMNRPMPDLAQGTVDMLGRMGQTAYIQQPDTMKCFRQVLHIPEIADRSPFQAWKDNGLTPHSLALKSYEKRINAYAAPQDSDSIRKELDAFVHQALA